MGLEKLKDFQAMRASSSAADWREGNGDARAIPPGETLTLADLQGPGIITHIWFTIAHRTPFYSRLLTLRMYWDGEEHPSVECPVGDFFGIGHGVDQPFMSIPIRVTSAGRARNCYWPMPFLKSARITVTNESDRRCDAFYSYIDWQKHESLPQDTAYFHAMYRQEHPCVMGRNYLLADIEGRGHYVGTVQSVYHVSPGWYGEGDDFFFIDGEQEPSLRGTGTEDYFCDAWGFRQQDGPYYGTPLWEGYGTGDRGTAYRFHIADPVPFTKSLRVEIEHKGSQSFPDGTTSGFIERDDLMSSVAFWYQLEPHKPWADLPAGQDRLPFKQSVLIEGEDFVETATHSGADLSIQAIGGASGGNQLWYRPADDQAWIEVKFTLDEALTADLYGSVIYSWDYGTYRVLLDGEQIDVMPMYSASVKPTSRRWGLRTLAAGEHTLRFECVGKPGDSKGYLFGFDALMARKAVYQRAPQVDLRTLQADKEE